MREQFGKPIAHNQSIQFMVADMAAEIDAARLLTLRAAWLKDHGRTTTLESSMAKLYKFRYGVAHPGKEARTRFRVLARGEGATLVEARPMTGRTHQIRAHLAAIGHPLVGDVTYGGEPKYGLTRPFLHSHRLGFVHPVSGERMAFSSALPADLAAALEAARSA